MKSSLRFLLLLLALALVSCEPLQPNYTPDVTALSASWGSAPVLNEQGAIIARGTATPARHPTIFHD